MSPNARRALSMLAAAGAATGIVALLVLWLIGLPLWLAFVLGIVIGAAVSWSCSAAAVPRALAAVKAEPADRTEHERLWNMLEGLSLTTGVRLPDAYVVDHAAIDALAVSRSDRDSAVVVTSGLLTALDVVELEGVLAHELSRIKSDEARLGTVAALLLGLPLSPWPGLRQRALDRILGVDGGVRADLEGIAITRYPPGLLGALQKMRAETTPPPGGAVAHLWVVGRDVDTPGTPRLSIDDRIAFLQEL